MNFLSVLGVSKTEKNNQVLKNISFEQDRLQKVAIAGETGSGKSTLLKVIAGLAQPGNGTVHFCGERVIGPDEQLIPGHKGVQYLSQQFELPKFLTVAQVLEYANKLTDKNASLIYQVCRIEHLMERRTNELSGGEQQRIAIARLLITSPFLLLLDEPYSNLDMIHKRLLKAVIRDIGNQLGITCILVSHDPLDTLSWADYILVMRGGKIIRQGTPVEVYHEPQSEYTAALFGNYSLINPMLFRHVDGIAPTDRKKLFVRPEFIYLVENRDEGVEAVVEEVNFLGSAYEAEVKMGWDTIYLRTITPIQRGQTVYVSLVPGNYSQQPLAQPGV